MNASSNTGSRGHRDGLFSAISVGFFLVLTGIFFVTVPNLYDEIVAFFTDLSDHLVQVPNLSNVYLPAPQDSHAVIYTTVTQFCLIWGVFLLVLLAARFLADSPTRRKADNLGDAFFWLGAAYLSKIWLVNSVKWFEFWAVIIVLIGVSLIVRAIFLAVAWMTRA